MLTLRAKETDENADSAGDRGSAATPDASLAALVARHQRGVWRFLRALGADSALAEELAADAFLLAWQKRIATTDERSVASWLVSTARHLWLRRLRENRRAEAALAASAEALWTRWCLDDGGDAWLEALRACLARTEGRTAQALRLCYEESLPRAELARALGMKENGVKTLLQRARQALRRCIEARLA